MNTNQVQCRDEADLLEVTAMCAADGFSYSVDALVVTFWRR